MRLYKRHSPAPEDSSSWRNWSWKKLLRKQVGIWLGPDLTMTADNFRLFNITQQNENEAVCSQIHSGDWIVDENGEDKYDGHIFEVGHSTQSQTTRTSWMVGHYLGDPARPCMTIIDTPGTGDTQGRDCEHGIALAKEIKQIGSIDAFVLLFKGTDTRFSQSMQDQIKLYMNIFGQEMWNNTITEFTFWEHSRKRIQRRKRKQGGLNEDTQHSLWNKEYEERFGVQQTIPSVFIDPVYDEEEADADEKRINEEYTDKLWNLVTQSIKPFQCDKRCQAPSEFFDGRPWLIPPSTLQNKRLGERSEIIWQIWFAGCLNSGAVPYNISQVTEDNTTWVIFQHFENLTVRDGQNMLPNMHIKEESSDKFKTIQLIIATTRERHFGSYFMETEEGRSELGQLRKKVDGEWQEWSVFGPCSKTCIECLEQPGLMQRYRNCKPPQNEGEPCLGEKTEKRTCAHDTGDDINSLR